MKKKISDYCPRALDFLPLIREKVTLVRSNLLIGSKKCLLQSYVELTKEPGTIIRCKKNTYHVAKCLDTANSFLQYVHKRKAIQTSMLPCTDHSFSFVTHPQLIVSTNIQTAELKQCTCAPLSLG